MTSAYTILDWISSFIPLGNYSYQFLYLEYLTAYMILFSVVLVVFNLVIGIILSVFSPRRMR